MKVYDVAPGVGVGPIRLGMEKHLVAAAMGELPRVIRKGGKPGPEIDGFHGTSFQVFYDDARRVKFIELSGGHNFSVFYRGIDVFSTPAVDIVTLVSKDGLVDTDDPEFGYSYIFPTLELSLWRPVTPDDSEEAEGRYFYTIGVGVPGYYNCRV